MYHVSTYYTTKVIAELPIIILNTLIYQIIFFFGIGLTVNAGHFFYCFFIWFLVSYCASAFGYFLSSVIEVAETAVMVGPIVMLPLILFGGFFSNLESIPDWIEWLQYLSPIRYGFEAIVRNEINQRGDIPPNVPNPLDYLSLNLSIALCIILLVILGIGLRAISMIFLKLSIKRFQ